MDDVGETAEERSAISSWYFGAVTRTAAETLLISLKANVFLVRTSSNPGCYALSLYDHQNSGILHLLIQCVEGGYLVGEKDPTIYTTVRDVVENCPACKGYTPAGKLKSKGRQAYASVHLLDVNQAMEKAALDAAVAMQIPEAIAASSGGTTGNTPTGGNSSSTSGVAVGEPLPPSEGDKGSSGAFPDPKRASVSALSFGTKKAPIQLFVTEGWLKKKGPGGKMLTGRWKKRWVSFRSENGEAGKLYYYKSDRDTKSLNLIDFHVVSLVHKAPPGTSKEEPWAFQIDTLTRTYYFSAPSETEMMRWITDLSKYVETMWAARATRTASFFAMNETDYLMSEWQRADAANKGRLGLKQIIVLMDKLNVKLPRKYIKAKFQEVDKDGSGSLDFSEFKAFLKLVRTRPEIDKIFSELTNGENRLTADQFLLFLKNEQEEENYTLDQVECLITDLEYTSPGTISDPGFLTARGFSLYISSTNLNNPLNATLSSKVYHDMTKPLSGYYIASSHNTCLLEGQLTGESSIQGFINAFAAGCRCVELDCWDGPKGIPILTHGNTFTTSIPFKDVIECIRDYAFKTTNYPAILSLDNHCSVPQQIVMADMIKETLGAAGMLPESFSKVFVGERMYELLPSPEELRGKVIIKGNMSTLLDTDVEEEDDEDADEDEGGKKTEEEYQNSQIRDNLSFLTDTKTIAKKKLKTSPDLSAITHLKAGAPFNPKGLELPIQTSWEMSSFTETRINRLISKNPEALVLRNQRHLSRTYPKGTRIASDNYDPIPAWNHGCQMVALNYQTNDLPLWLNAAKFSDNGGCGYLLKPDYMMQSEPIFNPKEVVPIDLVLRLRIISGWQLPKVGGKAKKGDIINPYVSVNIAGTPADSARTFKTQIVKSNGFNPVWDETAEFYLRRPTIAIFKMFIHNGGTNDYIGHSFFALPLLKNGYRSFQVHNEKGPIEGCSLLCHVSFSRSMQGGKYHEYSKDNKSSSFTKSADLKAS